MSEYFVVVSYTHLFSPLTFIRTSLPVCLTLRCIIACHLFTLLHYKDRYIFSEHNFFNISITCKSYHYNRKSQPDRSTGNGEILNALRKHKRIDGEYMLLCHSENFVSKSFFLFFNTYSICSNSFRKRSLYDLGTFKESYCIKWEEPY